MKWTSSSKDYDIRNENNNLKEQINGFEIKVDEIESYRRWNNIIIYGIQEHEHPVEISIEFRKAVHVNIKVIDIDAAYRLPTQKKTKASLFTLKWSAMWRKRNFFGRLKKLNSLQQIRTKNSEIITFISQKGNCLVAEKTISLTFRRCSKELLKGWRSAVKMMISNPKPGKPECGLA